MLGPELKSVYVEQAQAGQQAPDGGDGHGGKLGHGRAGDSIRPRGLGGHAQSPQDAGAESHPGRDPGPHYSITTI